MSLSTRDAMQNLSLTRIFHKLGQTHLAQARHDPDDLTWFQSWYYTYVATYVYLKS